MGRAAGAGTAYFTIVFLTGMVLGAFRIFVVAPRLGEVPAVLLECPVILTLSWFAAGWCARRFGVRNAPWRRLVMGATAFLLLMTAELALAVLVFHRTTAQHFAAYRSPAAAIGLAAQLVFAAMPWMSSWRSWSGLAVVRGVHTAIYLVMATATLVVLYAGVTGATGPWLWVGVVLVGIESAVFVSNGFKCPMTVLASRYGAEDGADTFLPARLTRYTFRVFGPLIALAFALLNGRWMIAHLG